MKIHMGLLLIFQETHLMNSKYRQSHPQTRIIDYIAEDVQKSARNSVLKKWHKQGEMHIDFI